MGQLKQDPFINCVKMDQPALIQNKITVKTQTH